MFGARPERVRMERQGLRRQDRIYDEIMNYPLALQLVLSWCSVGLRRERRAPRLIAGSFGLGRDVHRCRAEKTEEPIFLDTMPDRSIEVGRPKLIALSGLSDKGRIVGHGCEHRVRVTSA